jgi:predicted RNA-binding Zn ribbon-like protein
MPPDDMESLEWRGAAISAVTPWPCLDLVNTTEWRLSDENDFLLDYGDLVRWGSHDGLLGDGEARRLLQMAGRSPVAANEAHRRAVTLRSTLTMLLSAVARNDAPPAAALADLNAALAAATVPVRLDWDGGAYRREWLDPKDGPGWFLNAVVRSTPDFLLSPDVARLKECPGGPGRACGFLFLDETKNRSRRWCSSRTCGNRARQHRFYTRARG